MDRTYLAVEYQQGCLIVLAQNLIEELAARAALICEHRALAAAHIDQEAEPQRRIGLGRKIADHLRTAVFFERKIVLGEPMDKLPLFIANGGQNIDYIDASGEGGLLGPRERAD